MCGLCLPHCPTYQLSRNEADGPRGRLSLMLGLRDGSLEPDENVTQHLESCLSCRACEAMCPSLVPYGQLIDAARSHIRECRDKPTPQLEKWRNQLFSQRHVLTPLLSSQRLADRLGLGAITRHIAGDLGRALPKMLPKAARPFGTHPSIGPQRGRVGLFVGCTGSSMDADTTRAAITLLTAFGFKVIAPRAQACCGAMHRHGGDERRADDLVAANQAVFADKAVDAIVGITTACVAELRDFGHLNQPVEEISAFLARQPAEAWPPLVALDNQRAAIHLPCSQRNVLKQPRASFELLGHIPGLELIDLPGNEFCCGAAGMQRLSHSKQAAALREPKLRAIGELRPDYIVSSNIGCTLHLNVGLDAFKPRPPQVIHPITLLARCLRP